VKARPVSALDGYFLTRANNGRVSFMFKGSTLGNQGSNAQVLGDLDARAGVPKVSGESA